MKTVLFALLVYIMFVSSGNGQTNIYRPFPDPVIWRVDYYYDFEFQYPCRKHYYFQYYSTGDTLINSTVYKKIFLSGIYDTSTCTGGPLFIPAPGYMGALRDDPSANKSFFRFPKATEDSLLYDYNLAVGDTMKGFISYDHIYYYPVVSSIDSVWINGQYHKRWNFTQDLEGNYPYLIEGIGTSFGFIEPVFTYDIDNTQRYLICVRDSSITYFNSNHSSAIGCNLFVSVPCELPLLYSSLVFPNPFSKETTLKINLTIQNATISIINTFGQPVKQIKNFTGCELKLRRENLSAGIYFIRLIQENKIIASYKLIITD